MFCVYFNFVMNSHLKKQASKWPFGVLGLELALELDLLQALGKHLATK